MQKEVKIHSLQEEKFRKYGRIVKGFQTEELLRALQQTPVPQKGTIYVASDAELEKVSVFQRLQAEEFGGLPIQIGYCNGRNKRLNALEYHRSSEVNISCDDMILLLGSLQDVDPETNTYDTACTEGFFIPAGTMVEIYATTLHFAPCSVKKNAFHTAVILPRGTNEALQSIPEKKGEAQLLAAVNKWLIAHPESGLDQTACFFGLKGTNITLE
ncbi:MAG: DUF4867 family protein [Oscillospiraceae bacterium]|nr:DUF4867 family protein [Oscillospiraceae bacterium]